jgi:hypothetical protein
MCNKSMPISLCCCAWTKFRISSDVHRPLFIVRMIRIEMIEKLRNKNRFRNKSFFWKNSTFSK